ncbi:hypothetical protein [Massilia violaceinigra]|nr:hypothetical protein [Massilia violaceinigra]
MSENRVASSSKVKTDVKAFSDLVIGKAIILCGGAAILADAIQSAAAKGQIASFNVHELETFRWGKIFVARVWVDNESTAYLLKVRGNNKGARKDFIVPREVVVGAINDDASIIAAALMNNLDAMVWIGKNFEPSFLAAAQNAQIAFAAKVSVPTKSGSNPLRL